jgi:LuxR family transcriptional regulator, maltose regulon positive regulatory protein
LPIVGQCVPEGVTITMQKAMPLMFTKLKIPQPRKNYIIRSPLFSKLERFSECRLTVIKGGAGTGKTTLFTSFIREKAIPDVRWITLDEDSNDVFVFWNYFIEAVKDNLGVSAQDFLALFDANIQKDNLEQILTLMINRVSSGREMTLVLDDFQCVTDPFLLGTIDFFIKNLPDSFHLVLLTRQTPALYLGALGMDGQLLLIEEEDLKLTEQDGIRFLRETLALEFSEEILRYMSRLAEGWIGGLQLIAIAAAGKSEQKIYDLKFANRLLEDYITREIFDALSEEEKKFLVSTSILAYFNKKICKSLLGGIDFDQMISDVLDRNLLIISVDEENGIYRYHTLLGEYLKSQFNRLDKAEKTALHLKAAEVFNELGDRAECLNHLFAVKDYVQVMNLIMQMPHSAVTFSYLTKVPLEVITKNPDFAYQCFFYHYANFENEICTEIFTLIKERLANDKTFAAFQCANLFVEDTFKASEAKILSADQIESLPLNEVTRAFLLIKDAFLLFIQCKYEEALHFLERAMKVYYSTGNPYIACFVLSAKTQISEEMGNFHQCLDLYANMEKMLTELPVMKPNYFIGIAGVYLRQMDLVRAGSALASAEALLTPQMLSGERGYKYTLAAYLILCGQKQKGIDLIYEVLQMPIYQNTMIVAPLLKFILLNGEDEELCRRFLNDYEAMPEEERSLDGRVLYAFIQYQQGNSVLAMNLADDILKQSRKLKIKYKIVEADLLKLKILFENAGAKREILNLFREAVSYGSENEIRGPFWFESKTVAKLIKQFGSDAFFDLSEEEKEFIRSVTEKEEEEKDEILSKREQEVLRELSTGVTNKEIAEHLCISLATVKSHIINIYSKLGVNSRIAAADEARKIGISKDA